MHQAPDGWLPYYGPVRTVGYVGKTPDSVTVGNRVMAWWQRFGYVVGNATVVGFEVNEDDWIKVVVRSDWPDPLRSGPENDPHISRWDWDRTERVEGHWQGETQEESVGRQLAYLAEQYRLAAERR